MRAARPGGGTFRAVWTRDLLEMAYLLWCDPGVRLSEAVRRLGVTKGALCGAAHRRDWPPRRSLRGTAGPAVPPPAADPPAPRAAWLRIVVPVAPAPIRRDNVASRCCTTPDCRGPIQPGRDRCAECIRGEIGRRRECFAPSSQRHRRV